MVMEDLEKSSCVTNTDIFLEKILGMAAAEVKKIFDKLVSKKVYGASTPGDGRWRGFPTAPGKENELYKPFTDTANAIYQTCLELKLVQVQCTWLDRHSSAPESKGNSEDDAPQIRPDIVAVLGPPANNMFLDLEKNLKKLPTKVRDLIFRTKSTEPH